MSRKQGVAGKPKSDGNPEAKKRGGHIKKVVSLYE